MAGVRLSKLISLILRHRPADFGVVLDAAGWTSVEALLAALARRGLTVTPAELHALVAGSDKQRFALSDDGTRIRAQQGHSVAVALDHPVGSPPPRLYHGTVASALASIRVQGLVRGRRHHVHLSGSREQAERVGARRGAPVVLEIRAGAMAAAGHVFLLTPNQVWLTAHVPPEFLVLPD
jgi:putative RNA 2'-phosphotransferase